MRRRLRAGVTRGEAGCKRTPPDRRAGDRAASSRMARANGHRHDGF
ncbi:MAG: hypothetical protein OXH75_06575 [Acidobacteria bacterium]|nr:hypothetical protein [Acidobacteriota bacterium]